VITLQQRLVVSQSKCARLEEESLVEKIEELNVEENMKENILNCLQIAKASSANGIRYSQKWLCECIMLKIKSSKTYEHLRRHNTMPLPHPMTISRYIRKLKPTYGFQSGVFEMLKKHSTTINSMQREGRLSPQQYAGAYF
jgi:hypothetical protein